MLHKADKEKAEKIKFPGKCVQSSMVVQKLFQPIHPPSGNERAAYPHLHRRRAAPGQN